MQGEEELFPAAAALSIPLCQSSSGDTLFSLAGMAPAEWRCHFVQRLCGLGFGAIMAVIKMSLICNITGFW